MTITNIRGGPPQMPPTAEQLLNMPEGQFRSLVENDIRGTSDAREVLRSPQVIERLYSTLLSMQKSVEGQLAARKEDMEAARIKSIAEGRNALPGWAEDKAKYSKWRAGSIRFKVGLEQALMEVRHVRDQQRTENRGLLFEDEANVRLMRRLQMLEAAIKKHRDAFDENDEATDADLELWAYLPE